MVSYTFIGVFCLFMISTIIKSTQSYINYDSQCKLNSEPYLKYKIKRITRFSHSAQEAQFGEFPHMVALGYQDLDASIKYLCSGSIISEYFILTTARCLTSDDPSTRIFGNLRLIRLGSYDIKSKSRKYRRKYIKYVKNIYPHPDYKTSSHYFDIGLVEVTKRIKFTPNVRPAYLYQEANLPKKARFTVTYWDVFNKWRNFTKVHKVDLNIFTPQECEKAYYFAAKQNSKLITSETFNTLEICAGNKLEPLKYSCYDVTEGPLQFFSPRINNYMLVGLTSIRSGCEIPGAPSIYTRIQAYLPWINAIIYRKSRLT